MIPACAVALGGLVGSLARYWLNMAIHAAVGTVFPLGILVVNVLGCFMIGLVARYVAQHGASPAWILFLTTGVCGGFTTMSAFGLDTVLLAEQGHGALAALNVVLTLVVCLVAVRLGQLAGAAF
jgi:fluoride exporter